MEAFGRRFRRNYLWIYLILGGAWLLKTFLHPVPAASAAEMLARASLGPVPGEAVVAAGVAFNAVLFLVGFVTAGLTQASGEVLPKVEVDSALPVLGPLFRAMATESGEAVPKAGRPAAARPGRRRQILALIISSQPAAIADRVLKDLRRGATALHGRGMYAQQERDVLLVAITVTEMQRLKAIVRAADPNAFVIVAPAHEILGRGFQPLESH